jgi:hypothetical protein
MMNDKRVHWVRASALVCALVLAAGCSKESTGPTVVPGQLTVSVSTAGSAGAAFLVTVSGSGITNPVAGNASQRLYQMISGNTLKAAVIGSLSSGALLKFDVPDVNRASSYNVTLLQVAGSDNALLATGDWSVTVE